MSRIAVIDFETDPFKSHRLPRPFLFGFYDGSRFNHIWDEDELITRVTKFLDSEEPSLIYAHNGGKFDFHLGLVEYFTGFMKIINGRIVSSRLGKHELRDSFAIMPFPLREYMKDDIDYRKLEPDVRHLHRDEIVSYLRTDCIKLYELVTAFVGEFTNKLTVGSAALKQLRQVHKFSNTSARFDKAIREPYYFGGRNQCFESGIIEAPVKIYDVNSMYPSVMKNYLHPVGAAIHESSAIEENTCFVTVEGWNRNAFPVRLPTGGLDFTTGYGVYHTTIHEYRAALESGLFKTKRIHSTVGIEERISFFDFVTKFFDIRAKAKASNDLIRNILYKYVLNSSYGKFAQNPENYFDWLIRKPGDPVPQTPCEHCFGSGTCPETCYWCNRLRNRYSDTSECARCDGSGFKWSLAERAGSYEIWQARLNQLHFLNVATAASITGAARAVLMQGYTRAVRPLYCDTDSIICSSLTGHLSESDLGGWKLEAEGDLAAIGGKKLYAVFSYNDPGPNKRGEPAEHLKWKGRDIYLVKKAHKGAKLTGADILRICRGDECTVCGERGHQCYVSESPSYKLNGKHEFVKRKLRMTA